MSERHFAYGLDESNGVGCPAKTAGKVQNGFPDGPTGKYDILARGLCEEKNGLIDEETAKELWFEAILKELDNHHTRIGGSGELRRAHEGVEIAKKLGWL
jgi:hypothetical protein